MIRKLAMTLLAPATDAGGGAEVMDAPPESLKGWGSFEQELERINKGEKGGADDGKEAAGAGGNGANGGAAPKPNAGGTGGDTGASADAAAAKAKADADKAAADKAAADAAAAAKANEEQIPQSKKDWDKFKTVRKETEDKLKAEIAENKKQLETAQARIKEIEGAKPGEDPATKAEIERLTAENKELTDRLTVLDVTKHPKFEAHYNGRTTEQMERAKHILGDEAYKEFEAALKMPEGEEADAKFEGILENLSSIKKTKLGNVLQALDKIDQDKQADIRNAEQKRKEIGDKTKQQKDAITASRDKLFNDQLAKFQDKETGIPIFQERPGEENKEWNTGVQSRVQLARKILTGQDMSPGAIIQATFHAAAFPALLKSYGLAMKEKEAEISKLQEQVKKLSAAQATGGATGGESENGAEKPKAGTTTGKETSPHDISRSWVEKMRAGLQG